MIIGLSCLKLFSILLKRAINLRPYKAFTMDMHTACRNKAYTASSGESIERLFVPDDKVPWAVPWPSYSPPTFTMENLSKFPWADPDMKTSEFVPLWNKLDGKVNRQSHNGEYVIKDGYPLNPCGRTGLQGRGRLGRWGPNHAGDCIVTRWKRNESMSKVLNENTKLPVLQFVAIQRRDTLQWALPGGMVDAGESVKNTIKREFMEEALNLSEELFSSVTGKEISEFLNYGKEIYKGYVDDPRNTDNAWMETVAHLFHDESGPTVGLMDIKGRDDAVDAEWVDLSSNFQLYGNHSQIVKLAATLLNAHW